MTGYLVTECPALVLGLSYTQLYYTGYRARPDTVFYNRPYTGYRARPEAGFDIRPNTGYKARLETGFDIRPNTGYSQAGNWI